jgi:hypothetical protein
MTFLNSTDEDAIHFLRNRDRMGLSPASAWARR